MRAWLEPLAGRPTAAGGESLVARALAYACGVPYLLFIVEQFFLSPRVRVPTPMFGWPLIAYGLATTRREHWLSALPRWAWWVGVILALTVALSHNTTRAFAALLTFATCVLVFRHYVGFDAGRWLRLVRIFVALLLLSAVVLIVSRFNPDLGLGLRRLLFVYITDETRPLGLASYIHTFGYQMAALGAFTVAVIFCEKPRWQRLLLPFLITITGLATVWGMQRSAVVGVALASLVLLRRTRARELAFAGVILTILGLLAGPYIMAALDQPNVYAKHAADTKVASRMEMQVEALELIADYPLGHPMAGYSWQEVIAEKGGVLARVKTSPHNAYLQVILLLGWGPGLLMIWGLWGTGRAVWHTVGHPRHPRVGITAVAMGAALVATLVNATLHNESLFNGDGPTVLCYVAVHHWFDILSSNTRAQREWVSS